MPAIFSETIQTKCKPEEAFHILLEISNFKGAAQILAKITGDRSLWSMITKFATYKTELHSAEIELLFTTTHKLINEWVSKASRSRPDHYIAEAIFLIKNLCNAANKPRLSKNFNSWFVSFQKTHYRKSNLRVALKQKGINF